MRKLSVFYFSFIWLLLFSPYKGSCQESQYFPLNVGNTWSFDYNLSPTIFENTIVGVETIDNIDYFRFSNYWVAPQALLRLDEQNQVWEHEEDTEFIRYKLDASVGESWDYPNGLIIMESRNDTVTVPAGTFTGCLKMRYYFNGTDNDWEEWLAPGVGPVKRIHYTIFVNEYSLTDFNLDVTSGSNSFGKKIEGLALLPIAPNPLNLTDDTSASTNIQYRIPPEAGIIKVDLSIYDTSGRKVRALAQVNVIPGLHQISWNGRNAQGNFVPAGVYFISLTARNTVIVRKILVLR